MNYSWPSWVTSPICLSCATVQLYWGGQDKQGRFHAEYLWVGGNLGMSLFFLGPYALLAVSSLIRWRQRALTGRWVLIVVLCAIGTLAGWAEHDRFLQTPPGRETQPMLNFLATLVVWFGSVVILVPLGFSRSADCPSLLLPEKVQP